MDISGRRDWPLCKLTKTGRKIDGVRIVDSTLPKTGSITTIHLHRFRNRERSCLFDCVWQNQSRVIRYESIQSKCTFEAFNSFSIFPLFLDEIYRGLSSRLRFVMEKLAKFEEKKDCTQSFLLELRHICSRMLFPSSLSLSLTSSLPFSIPNPSNKRHPRY